MKKFAMKQMEIEAKLIFRKIYKILIKLSSSSNMKQKRKKKSEMQELRDQIVRQRK